jgi:hypothetical protein
MPKPTSTSLPSGTSAPTAGTGNKPKAKRKPKGRFDNVVARIEGLSHDQLRKSLVAAGIMTEGGELAAKYRKPRK